MCFGRDQESQLRMQLGRIVRIDVQSRITPHLPQAGDIPQHQRAARQRCFERGEPEWLVTRRRGIDRRDREFGGERFGRQTAQGLHVVQRTIRARVLVVGRTGFARDPHRPWQAWRGLALAVAGKPEAAGHFNPTFGGLVIALGWFLLALILSAAAQSMAVGMPSALQLGIGIFIQGVTVAALALATAQSLHFLKLGIPMTVLFVPMIYFMALIQVLAIPLVLLGLVTAHIMALHEVGSNNPDGVEIKNTKDPKTGHPVDGIPFHPYYTVKDTLGVVVFAIVFCVVMFFMPEMGGYFLEYNNFIPADPLKTPPHIAPV